MREVTDTAMDTEGDIGTIDIKDLAMMMIGVTGTESAIGIDLTEGTTETATIDEGMIDVMTAPHVVKGVMMMLRPLVEDHPAMILADHLPNAEAVGVPKIQPAPQTEEAQLLTVFWL